MSINGGTTWYADSMWIYGNPNTTRDIAVRTVLSVDCGDTQGWSFGLTHDNASVLEVLNVTTTGTHVVTIQNGGPPDFDATEIREGFEGFTQAVAIDFGSTAHKLAPKANVVVAGACYRVTFPTSGSYPVTNPVDIELSDQIGEPPVKTILVQGGIPIVPCVRKLTLNVVSRTSGSTTSSSCNIGGTWIVSGDGGAPGSCGLGGGGGGAVPASFPPFSCGETNGDGTVDLSDAVRLLCFLFQGCASPFGEFPVRSVTKTMQDTCYTDDGVYTDAQGFPTCPAVESDTFYGQDGQFQFGEANFPYGSGPGQRYSINQNGTPAVISDDTVTDNATGLVWTRQSLLTPAVPAGGWAALDLPPPCSDYPAEGTDSMLWVQANKAAEDLSRGGFDDWRLPTALELISIGHYEQAIDSSIFEIQADNKRVWSQSFFTANAESPIYFNFGSFSAHLNTDNRCSSGLPHSVLAVRRPAGFQDPTLHDDNPADPPGPDFTYGDANGDGAADISDAVYILAWLFLGSGLEPCNVFLPMSPSGLPASFQRFKNNGNGTVTDWVTGLMWAQAPPAGTEEMFDWKGALARAKNENTLGAPNDDWRLPNVAEMATLLVHGAEANEVNPPQFFPRGAFTVAAGSGRIFWSSTTDLGAADYAFKANFDLGVIHNVRFKNQKSAGPMNLDHEPARVWLVRGPIDGRE
ncbi:MAG: DUF1566 domain-containing protein [Planctomycetes bacterium]|nr:DUF1566 domain-containing protein [Planctomycetota bacterium]